MTREEYIRELVGKATDQAPDPSAPFRLGSVSSAEVRPVESLWEGYLLKGQITLLDARGGSGKTSLLALIAACGSVGMFPFGPSGDPIEVKPFRSLMFNTEDDRGDIRVIYEECGGDPEFLEVYDPDEHGQLTLDGAGLERLENFILVNGFEFVCFDPVLQYLPREVKSQNDNVAVTQFLAAQRRVAMKTGATFVNVRHFARAQIGRDASESGAGGEAWRNSSRGQLAMFPHPECRKDFFQALVLPTRATARTVKADPFGIEIKTGRRLVIPPGEIDLEPYAEKYAPVAASLGKNFAPKVSAGKRGPDPKAKQLAVEELMLYLQVRGGSAYSRETTAALEAKGISKSTTYNAKKDLEDRGLLSYDKGKWILTLDADPWADDVPEGRGEI